MITTPERDPTTAAGTLGPDCCATVTGDLVVIGITASLVVVRPFVSAQTVKTDIFNIISIANL